MRIVRYALVALPALALASAAQAANLTPARVFADATPASKAIMLILLASVLVSIVMGVLKLMSGPQLSGGSAYLSAMRFGGPLVGLLGAAWVGLNMFVGVANLAVTPPFKVLAPGFAEAALLLALGFLAGAVAVIMNWMVEARIDRAVLRA